jgi:hypothetical protein
MSLPCDICEKMGHPWFDCPKRSTKPPDWKPERLTRAKPDLPANRVRHVSDASPAPASGLDLARRTDGPIEQHVLASARPAPTSQRTIGRPKTITDMKAYKREKAVKYRANKKAKEAN